MKTNQNRRSPRKWTIVALIALTILGVSWALFNESNSLKAQSQKNTAPLKLNQGVFTSAHSGAGPAVRHFFGIRPEAVQPVAYQHKPHLEKGKGAPNFSACSAMKASRQVRSQAFPESPSAWSAMNRSPRISR